MADALRADDAACDKEQTAEHGARLTIDLGALAANWRRLRDRAAPAECAAVVKADAYGIGIEPAVRALWAAGCRTFFVAHLSEAAGAKASAPEATVYVLNGVLPDTASRFRELGVRPVLGSMADVQDWIRSGQRQPAALHVDTGMNRLGLSMQEARDLAGGDLVGRLGPMLLMSHLVAAESPAHPVNARQVAAFGELRRMFPSCPASLANSSGIFLPGSPGQDLVRPGYALYGGNPTPGTSNPMQAVVRLEASIIQLRALEPGETVGYGAGWTARRPTQLATLSVGYADGYPRAGGRTDETDESRLDRGAALVGGHLCPFVGRVSMDLVVIDVTDAPPEAARRGAPATLIGDGLDLDEVGRRAGTIGYEVLTSLGRRYARRYEGA